MTDRDKTIGIITKIREITDVSCLDEIRAAITVTEKDYYILFLYNDIEPELYGAYLDSDVRDEKAKCLRSEFGEDHGIYPLEVDKGTKVSVDTFSGEFFDGIEE